MALETKTVIGVVSSTGFDPANPADVAALSSQGSDWANADGNNTSTDVRVSLASPSGNPTTGANLQTIGAYVRKSASSGTGTPTARIEVWENGGGAALATSAEFNITNTSSQLITLTWDASLLTNATGSTVEIVVVTTKSGGNPSTRASADIDYIYWDIDYQTAVAQTFDSDVVGTSSVSADLFTQITFGGDVTASSSTSADLTTQIIFDSGINGTSVITGEINTSITFSGDLVGSSTVIGDMSTPILFDGNLIGTSTISGDIEFMTTSINGDITGSALLTGTLADSTTIPVEIFAAFDANVSGSSAATANHLSTFSGDIEIDFSVLGDANPYTDPAIVSIGNGVKIENGECKSTNVLGGFYSSAVPSETTIVSKIILGSGFPDGDPIGPALLDTSGNGYWFRCNYNETRIMKITAGVADGYLTFTNNSAVGGDELQITIDETTNTITTYINGSLVDTHVDASYTSLRAGFLTSWDNVNSAGAVKWGGNGYLTSSVTSDLDLRYSLVNVISQDLDIEYNVDSSASAVTSDVSLQWNTISVVDNDLELQTNVLNNIERDLDLQFSVFNSSTSDIDVRWDAINSIEQDIDVQYNVSTSVQDDLDIQYNVVSSVASDVDLSWDIDSLAVTSDVNLQWNVGVVTLTGPDILTDGSAATLTGTGLDIITSVVIATTDDNYSIGQTISSQDFSNINIIAESGFSNSSLGTPFDGVPLEPTIIAADATPYQLEIRVSE